MNKKNMKKWMALFLSLAMILTSGVLTISPGLLASEEIPMRTPLRRTHREHLKRTQKLSRQARRHRYPRHRTPAGKVQLNHSSQNRPLSLLLRKQKQTMSPFPCRPSLSRLQLLTALP